MFHFIPFAKNKDSFQLCESRTDALKCVTSQKILVSSAKTLSSISVRFRFQRATPLFRVVGVFIRQRADRASGEKYTDNAFLY